MKEKSDVRLAADAFDRVQKLREETDRLAADAALAAREKQQTRIDRVVNSLPDEAREIFERLG